MKKSKIVSLVLPIPTVEKKEQMQHSKMFSLIFSLPVAKKEKQIDHSMHRKRAPTVSGHLYGKGSYFLLRNTISHRVCVVYDPAVIKGYEKQLLILCG